MSKQYETFKAKVDQLHKDYDRDKREGKKTIPIVLSAELPIEDYYTMQVTLLSITALLENPEDIAQALKSLEGAIIQEGIHKVNKKTKALLDRVRQAKNTGWWV